jgi:hypothetical protein
MYVVEIGGLEVIVTLLAKGSRKRGTQPRFEVEAGVDWDGCIVPLCDEDRASAVAWVSDTYHDEVYHG